MKRLEDDEQRAEVGADAVHHERLAGDVHRVGDARLGRRDLLNAVHHGHRPLQRRRVGQLDVDDQIALVLAGDEAAGQDEEAVDRRGEQGRVEQQHDAAEAEVPAHQPGVDAGYGVEENVEAAEDPAEQPVDRPDNQPAERRADHGPRQEEGGVKPPRQERGLEAAGVAEGAFALAVQAEPAGGDRPEQPERRRPAGQGEEPPRQRLSGRMRDEG